MVREFLISLRKNFIINSFLIILTILSIHLLFLLGYFGTVLDIASPLSPPPLDGYEIFQIQLEREVDENNVVIDESDDLLERLQIFYYDFLLTNDAFDYFAFGMGQPLEIGDHLIKVENLNLNAFHVFARNFEFVDGDNFNENDFTNFRGYFPILLGYNFNEVNNVGDVFIADYFSTPIELKVIGILDQNQSFHHPDFEDSHWLLNNPLDNYILLPFISHRNKNLTEEEWWLWYGIYSTLTSGFLLVENTPQEINRAINLVHSAAAEIQLPYRLTGAANRMAETIEIQNLVRHQREIMLILFLNISIILFVIILIFMGIKYRMREKTYYTLMLTGQSKWKISLSIFLETALMFGIGFIVTHEYLVFDSGLLWTRAIFTSPATLTNPDYFTRWWMYQSVWIDTPALWYIAIFNLILCLVSIIYPSIKLKLLYKRGR